MPLYSDMYHNYLGSSPISPSYNPYSSLSSLRSNLYSYSRNAASNIYPSPLTTLGNYSSSRYVPRLAPISESLSSNRRAYKPSHYSPRPITINTSDIDVSANRYKEREPPPPPPPPSSSTKTTEPEDFRSTINRHRKVVRLNTIRKAKSRSQSIERRSSGRSSCKTPEQKEERTDEKKDSGLSSPIESPSGPLSPNSATWREKVGELLQPPKKVDTRSPGEKFLEKHIIKTESPKEPKTETAIFTYPPPTSKGRRSSIVIQNFEKLPTFEDICQDISSDKVDDDLNAGELRRQTSRLLEDDLQMFKDLRGSVIHCTIEKEVEIEGDDHKKKKHKVSAKADITNASASDIKEFVEIIKDEIIDDSRRKPKINVVIEAVEETVVVKLPKKSSEVKLRHRDSQNSRNSRSSVKRSSSGIDFWGTLQRSETEDFTLRSETLWKEFLSHPTAQEAPADVKKSKSDTAVSKQEQTIDDFKAEVKIQDYIDKLKVEDRKRQSKKASTIDLDRLINELKPDEEAPSMPKKSASQPIDSRTSLRTFKKGEYMSHDKEVAFEAEHKRQDAIKRFNDLKQEQEQMRPKQLKETGKLMTPAAKKTGLKTASQPKNAQLSEVKPETKFKKPKVIEKKPEEIPKAQKLIKLKDPEPKILMEKKLIEKKPVQVSQGVTEIKKLKNPEGQVKVEKQMVTEVIEKKPQMKAEVKEMKKLKSPEPQVKVEKKLIKSPEPVKVEKEVKIPEPVKVEKKLSKSFEQEKLEKEVKSPELPKSPEPVKVENKKIEKKKEPVVKKKQVKSPEAAPALVGKKPAVGGGGGLITKSKTAEAALHEKVDNDGALLIAGAVGNVAKSPETENSKVVETDSKTRSSMRQLQQCCVEKGQHINNNNKKGSTLVVGHADASGVAIGAPPPPPDKNKSAESINDDNKDIDTIFDGKGRCNESGGSALAKFPTFGNLNELAVASEQLLDEQLTRGGADDEGQENKDQQKTDRSSSDNKKRKDTKENNNKNKNKVKVDESESDAATDVDEDWSEESEDEEVKRRRARDNLLLLLRMAKNDDAGGATPKPATPRPKLQLSLETMARCYKKDEKAPVQLVAKPKPLWKYVRRNKPHKRRNKKLIERAEQLRRQEEQEERLAREAAGLSTDGEPTENAVNGEPSDSSEASDLTSTSASTSKNSKSSSGSSDYTEYYDFTFPYYVKDEHNNLHINSRLSARSIDSGIDNGSELSASTKDPQESSYVYTQYSKTGKIIPPATVIPRFKKYNIDDFHFLAVLGKGSFGKVFLAELKGTEYYYAVKGLKKDIVLEDDDVECTLIERKVLALGTKHPFLCHLFCTFQTDSHLFFVLEYLNGGDLMFHIQRSGRFEEDRARFYAAEIVSGLKFLHKKGIIYRDLKLDNILLDFEGHARIADFGMCKLEIYLDRTADSFCGTPDYMAPEIIKGDNYNQAVDWWSFGVLVYEMLIGQSPFSGCDEDELFWSICNEIPWFPQFLSKEALRFLKALLEKDASIRLGSLGTGDGDVEYHPFFKKIDWTKLEQRGYPPPFKPEVLHPLDTKYFDNCFTKERARLTLIDKNILKSINQEQFEGFTYTNPNATLTKLRKKKKKMYFDPFTGEMRVTFTEF